MASRRPVVQNKDPKEVKHFQDQRDVRNAQGGMGVFKHVEFWEAYHKLGHSTLEYHKCECKERS